MTEPTIAKVLAKYPYNTRFFIDENNNEWERVELALQLRNNDAVYIHENVFDSAVIPGLKPKPHKRKVTETGFIHNPGIPLIAHAFTRVPYCNQGIPATLTYETDAEPEQTTCTANCNHSIYSNHSGKYRCAACGGLFDFITQSATFTEVDDEV